MELLFSDEFLKVIHAAATWSMVGVIWIVQVVHYPLFAKVGDLSFHAYHRVHTTRITFIVMPLMLIELASALALCALPLPRASHLITVWGLALLGIIWISTFGVQVPQHERLAGGFVKQHHNKLVMTNWIRTVGWSIRGLLAAALILIP